MRNLSRSALIALSIFIASCSDTLTPMHDGAPRFSSVGTMPEIRFSEIHYDNAGADADERIEISGPVGLNVSGYRVILYNGSGGASYGTLSLSGVIPATCGARGVMVLDAPGLQNGSPDGMALIAPDNSVVEFLSYEGTFTASNGPAAGMLSTDIGVSQNENEPPGSSLERDPYNSWAPKQPLGTNSFGNCNDHVLSPSGPIVDVTVTPASASIYTNATQQFTATAFDANGTPVPATFTWASSANAIASVNASGLATAHEPGDVTITATAPNGVSGAATLHADAAPPVVTGIIRVSELHYDNAGTDVNEAIEIEGPAGAVLTGWRVLLYNGNGGGVYNTRILSGVIPATCGSHGVIVLTYPANGIQNGSPDGLALVAPNDSVAEFWSYEGPMTATDGPAAGMAALVMPVDQAPDNSVPIGLSLQRDSAGNWYGPHTASFGSCNTPPPQAAPVVISEIMADPLNATGGATWGEWFEVHNHSSTAVDLNGWTILSAGGASQPPHVINRSVIVPAGGYAVLGRGDDPERNGGVTLDYNYFSGSSTTIFLDATDYIVLRDANGMRVDSVRWTSSATMVKGTTRALRNLTADNTNVDGASWGYSTTPFGDGDYGTPGAPNGTISDTPPFVPNSVRIFGRSSSDPALPVGFQDQIFASLINGSGEEMPSGILWESLTPSILTIDANGVIKALAEGTARVRATAIVDGTSAEYLLPIRTATAGGTAQYGANTEFGEPGDDDPRDDFIIRYPQFTASYNPNRNTPNWVSYNIDGTHFGPEDRCNCFTFDEGLPSTFTRYTTADYTGASAFHGYAIDRGHLARSFDRTSGSLDNAVTFYFTNIIPQSGDQNRGPWAAFEDSLGNLARFHNREIYVIAGVAGNKGTVKNEGKIVIPEYAWKVAVVMPRDHGLADVTSPESLEVIAVIMPNIAGVHSDWTRYKATVDEVEALSGYDLLALLPDPIEIIVESNSKPPVARTDGPYASTEGAAITMSAAASTDPDGDVLNFTWSFGDGQTATGTTVTHTYAQDGNYKVRLIAVDPRGLADTITTAAIISNVAPSIAPISGATLLPRETYLATGSFTDPGADVWAGTVDYGDGITQPLAMTGQTFALSHTYTSSGTYTVTVTIADDDDARSVTATVIVLANSDGVQQLVEMIDQLVASGVLNAGNGNALTATLQAAFRQLERGNLTPAVNQLGAFGNQLDALLRSGRLERAQYDALRAALKRVLDSLGG